MLLKHQSSHAVRSTRVPLMVLCMLFLGLSAPWVANGASQACQGTTVAEVKGMSCPFCAYGLRKHLLAIPGVKSVRVDLNKSEATIDPKNGTHVSAAQIQQAIKDAGFTPGRIQCEVPQKVGRAPAFFRSAEFKVAGMQCGHCATSVTAALEKHKGVRFAAVDLAAKRATVSYKPQAVQSTAPARAIEQAGKFQAQLLNTSTAGASSR